LDKGIYLDLFFDDEIGYEGFCKIFVIVMRKCFVV